MLWAPGTHLREPWLDVEDRGAVDRVQVLHVQIEAVHLDQAATRYTEPVEPAHVAVPEGADLGPGGVVARTTCAEVQVVGVGQMETEDDLQVREVLQPLRGVRGEARVIDTDDGPCAAPEVVGRLLPSTHHVGQRLHGVVLFAHAHSSLRLVASWSVCARSQHLPFPVAARRTPRPRVGVAFQSLFTERIMAVRMGPSGAGCCMPILRYPQSSYRLMIFPEFARGLTNKTDCFSGRVARS